MAAQYRPFRDDDNVDMMETTSWTDNEPGTLQIYEKTTEELPFNSANRRAFWAQIAFCSLSCLLGFLLGYLGPIHHTNILEKHNGDTHTCTHDHLDLHEDPTIKDKLMAQIDSNNILFVLKKYENTNRIPGSHSDHEFAQYIHDAFHDSGLNPISITNKTFRTMLPRQPSVVKLLNNDGKTLFSNMEQDAYLYNDTRPFLPLSQAVNQTKTTDQILYMNKGLKEDYAKLQSLGLSANDTKGKVFVMKQSFHQVHEVVRTAQESGAEAILFFPDPELYGDQSPFPKSVQLPNDAAKAHPLAWSNYGDLESLNLTSFSSIDISNIEKETKIQIPVVLISFKTAETLLAGLSGPPAPRDWNCFEFTLHVGPGYKERDDKREKIQIEFDNQEQQISTSIVTGVITGAIEPDRYVIIGSRRDSLNRGLLDSVSGTATMLEIARVYGNLVKQGWRPRRTIVFSSFGAESLNLIGSSGWLESRQRLFHSRAIAYINCDMIVTGNHSATIAASPLLFQVLYNSTKQVVNPNPSDPHLRTVYDVWRSMHTMNRTDLAAVEIDRELNEIIKEHIEPMQEGETKIANDSSVEQSLDGLGEYGKFFAEYRRSASIKSRPKTRKIDLHSIYSPFILYAGIPVVDVRFSGFQVAGQSIGRHVSLFDDFLPVIGSKYDNFSTLQQIDPELKYHVTIAQILSEVLRDLSDSVFLPFNLLDYAVTLLDSYAHFEATYDKTIARMNFQLGKCTPRLFMGVVQLPHVSNQLTDQTSNHRRPQRGYT